MTKPSSPLRLNVSGRRFEVLPSGQGPSSGRLATLLSPSSSDQDRLELADAVSGDSELFFARSSSAFESVLDWALGPRHLALHGPARLCAARFEAEAAFWGVAEFLASSCACASHPQTSSALLGLTESSELDGEADGASGAGLSSQSTTAPLTGPVGIRGGALGRVGSGKGRCLDRQRAALWESIEEPHSSKVAGVFAVLSVLFVLISVVGLIVGSVPECQVLPDMEPHPVLQVLEYICIGWFTFEYVLRLGTTPSVVGFCMEPMDIIDLVSILPFYIEASLVISGVTIRSIHNLKGALLVMRLLRVLRVARIFKLARYSAAMKSCGKTLKESRREVGMLVIFVGIMIVLFSTTVYFMEKDVPDTDFISIPATFWWCIITITTVGYGDMSPSTIGGRLVASLASIAGVVVLAFPITVIVENFYRYYRKEKVGEAALDGAAPVLAGPRRIRIQNDPV